MSIEYFINKLYSLHTFGIKLGLDNIQKFLHYIGNPQKGIKPFHIAGSNGKGSTAAYIASILMELDYKTGLYTSPHFVRFNERVKINNREIPDSYVAEFISQHEKYIDEFGLTFFEVTTAMAFKYFYENAVDFAVIETGLGGRLDATNVLDPLAVIITSISLEHTKILGNTLFEIANEKAAIIKGDTKVFVGNLPQEALTVIENKCVEKNASLFNVNDYLTESGNILNSDEISEWENPLKGAYQENNAFLAALSVSKVFRLDDFYHIKAGIKNVIKNTSIQGRYEFFRKKPDIIFDSAHNPDGVKSFLNEFRKDYGKYSKKTLLFTAMKDKNIKQMLLETKDHFDEIVVTELAIERSSKIYQLSEIASEVGIKVKEETEIIKFIDKFEKKDENECLVVLGSMYLLGEIKSSFVKKTT